MILSTSIVTICYSQLIVPISFVSLVGITLSITKQVLANLDKFWKFFMKYWFVCTANERPRRVLRRSIKVKGHMISVQHNCSIAQVFRCSFFMFWFLKMGKAVKWLCNFLNWSACLLLLFEMFIFHRFTHSLTGLRVNGVMDVSWCICTCWHGNNGVWRDSQKLQG